MQVCDVNLNVVFGLTFILCLLDCKRAFISFGELFLRVTVKCEGSLGKVREQVYGACYMRATATVCNWSHLPRGLFGSVVYFPTKASIR